MENAMTAHTVRDIEIVTNEINFFKAQTQRALLEGAIEIGRRLTEAKSLVEHGQWGQYLKEKVDFSVSTANNMMRIFEEYGTGQTSMFGNSQSIMNLPYTKALKLLALPAEEREEFAEENDVANKSVREIDELLRQRDEAIADAKREQENAELVERRLEETRDTLAYSQHEVERLAQKLTQKQAEVEKITNDLSKARAEAEDKKKKLAEAKKNPTIPAETMERLQKEAAAQEAEKAEKKYSEQLSKAQKELQEVKRKLDVANKQVEEEKQNTAQALKQLQLASPEAAVFTSVYNQWMDDFNRVSAALYELNEKDPAMGAKMRSAVLDLLEQQKQALMEE